MSGEGAVVYVLPHALVVVVTRGLRKHIVKQVRAALYKIELLVWRGDNTGIASVIALRDVHHQIMHLSKPSRAIASNALQ